MKISRSTTTRTQQPASITGGKKKPHNQPTTTKPKPTHKINLASLTDTQPQPTHEINPPKPIQAAQPPMRDECRWSSGGGEVTSEEKKD